MSQAGLIAGVGAAGRGLRVAVSSREVWRAYWVLVLAVVGVALLLDVVGIASVVALSRSEALTGGDLTGLVRAVAVVVGSGIVLLAAPIVALVLVNLVAPLLGERLLLAGLGAVNPARAAQLAVGPGLPVSASAWCNLRRLVRFVLLSLACMLLGVIPILGVVLAPAAELWVAAITLGWELLDPYLSLRGMRYPQQRAWMRAHRPALIGFALPYLLPFGVPLLGPFLIGFAHAAAGVLVVDVLEVQDTLASQAPVA